MKLKLLVLSILPLLAIAQSLPDFEKRITEFTLPNGLHFIIFERHEAPVVSFHSFVNAGSVDDPSGETGIAHMFEHMAFKGTDKIGKGTGKLIAKPFHHSKKSESPDTSSRFGQTPR